MMNLFKNTCGNNNGVYHFNTGIIKHDTLNNLIGACLTKRPSGKLRNTSNYHNFWVIIFPLMQ